MNIGIILNYFRYFLAFDDRAGDNRFYYLAKSRRFGSQGKENFPVFDASARSMSAEPLPDGWETWFEVTRRFVRESPGDSSDTQLALIADLYKQYFERNLLKNRIELLIGSSVSGFERCGMSVARRLGIRTLHVWEGFFRPDTISLDPQGMNAASSFRSLPLAEHKRSLAIPSARDFVASYVDSLKKAAPVPTLRTVQAGRFNLLWQARNRLNDRQDPERIRLPLSQHLASRLSYIRDRARYIFPQDLRGPFLLFVIQTHTDSNVVTNDALFPYAEYVKRVIEAWRLAFQGSDTELVLKEHPLDVFRVAYDRRPVAGVRWAAPECPTTALINHPKCLGVVTVNSTAGFESVLLGKPVMVLGRSLYDYDEIVTRPDGLSAGQIAEGLRKLPEFRPDPESVLAIACSMYDRMTMQGNLDRSPGEAEMKMWEERFMRIGQER